MLTVIKPVVQKTNDVLCRGWIRPVVLITVSLLLRHIHFLFSAYCVAKWQHVVVMSHNLQQVFSLFPKKTLRLEIWCRTIPDKCYLMRTAGGQCGASCRCLCWDFYAEPNMWWKENYTDTSTDFSFRKWVFCRFQVTTSDQIFWGTFWFISSLHFLLLHSNNSKVMVVYRQIQIHCGIFFYLRCFKSGIYDHKKLKILGITHKQKKQK